MRHRMRHWINLCEARSLRSVKIADIDLDAAMRHHDLPDAGIVDYRAAMRASKAELATMFARQQTIEIYRVIVTDLANLDLDDLGISWAWDSDGALKGSGVGHGNQTALLISATVDEAYVNWHYTIAMNAFDPEEQEIVLRDGAPIKLISIHQVTGYTIGQNITPATLAGTIATA